MDRLAQVVGLVHIGNRPGAVEEEYEEDEADLGEDEKVLSAKWANKGGHRVGCLKGKATSRRWTRQVSGV
jgi:hypothetical protein